MLADVTRVRIVLALVNEGELSVSRLAERAGKLPTVVSQHLAKVFYQLVDEHAADLVRHAVMQAEHAVANGAVPPHHQVAGAAEEISA